MSLHQQSTVVDKLLSVNKHCQTPVHDFLLFGARILIWRTNLLNGSAVIEVNVLNWWDTQSSKNVKVAGTIKFALKNTRNGLFLMSVKYDVHWPPGVPIPFLARLVKHLQFPVISLYLLTIKANRFLSSYVTLGLLPLYKI